MRALARASSAGRFARGAFSADCPKKKRKRKRPAPANDKMDDETNSKKLTHHDVTQIFDEMFDLKGGRLRYESKSFSKHQSKSKNFYGSVYPDFVERILERELSSDRPFLFVDLGSGIGNTLIQTTLRNPRACAVGIEIVRERHEAALSLLSSAQKYDATIAQRCLLVHGSFAPVERAATAIVARAPYGPSWPPGMPEEATLVDILRRADVVFLNNAEGTMNERRESSLELTVCRLMRCLKVGARLLAMDSLAASWETNRWEAQPDQLGNVDRWMRERTIDVEGGVSWQRGRRGRTLCTSTQRWRRGGCATRAPCKMNCRYSPSSARSGRSTPPCGRISERAPG